MYSDSGSTCSPILTISAPSFLLASASSKVGSSSCRPLTKTTSAFSSSFAVCGGGSKVWLFVPSGTIPSTSARSPAMLAAMEVMGATVVAMVSRSADPADELLEEPQAARPSAVTRVRTDSGQDRLAPASHMRTIRNKRGSRIPGQR